MNYKKIMHKILLILFLNAVYINSVSANIYNTDSPSINIVAEEISPEPVEPGQDLTIKIRISNDGSVTAEDVKFKLNATYPFFIKTESHDFDNIGNLCAGCSVDNTYYLVVDADAKSGIYPLNFEIYSKQYTYKPGDTINIKVAGKPDLILETKQIEKNISSGDIFKIEFDIKNIGTGVARNIKITPLSDNILMIGSNIYLINELKPDETSSFDSEFIIKESLKPDTYKFPVKLSYVDEQGNHYESSFDIGVNILERADIYFQSIKITPPFPTLVDQIHMEGIIENTGTGNADNVVVELITPSNKSYKSFIGQLKSDDDAPFYFDVKPESVGIQTAILKVTYIDDFGTHTIKTTINKDVKRPANNLVKILVILIIVILLTGYFYLKRKKSRK